MTWILTTLLFATILAWIKTSKYQHNLAELRAEIASKESDHLIELHLLTNQYDEQNKKLVAENDRIRRNFK